MSNSTMTLTNGKVQDGEVHVSIEAAGDSVDMTEEDEPAIVIIQEEQLETSEIDSSFPTHIINNEVRAWLILYNRVQGGRHSSSKILIV